MLREMLRLRLVSNLPESERNRDFFTMWRQLCDAHCAGEESSAYLIERSLMRPRNLLKIFTHCRGFAANFQRQRITAEDINKGLLAYSQDLIEELDRELTDVFPEARDLLYHFLDGQAVLSHIDLTRCPVHHQPSILAGSKHPNACRTKRSDIAGDDRSAIRWIGGENRIIRHPIRDRLLNVGSCRLRRVESRCGAVTLG